MFKLCKIQGARSNISSHMDIQETNDISADRSMYKLLISCYITFRFATRREILRIKVIWDDVDISNVHGTTRSWIGDINLFQNITDGGDFGSSFYSHK